MSRVGPSGYGRYPSPGLLGSGVRLTLVLVLALGALGCSLEEAPPSQPVFRVGVLALFEGLQTAGSGVPTLQAATMAAEELNASGGIEIGGVLHRIEIVDHQHPFRVEEVTTAARSLINRDSVHALVGPQYSQHAVPVGAIAERAGLPMISPMSSSPATTAGRDFVFRIAFLDAAQGQVLARFAREQLGLERVAVVRSLTNPYSSDVAERFSEVFRELGGQVIETAFPGGGPDVVREAFRRVLPSSPQRVLLPLETNEVTEVLRLIEEEGLQIGLLGTDSWDVALIQEIPQAQDAYLTHQWMWTIPDPGAAAFVERYGEAHGEPPRSTAAVTYDAVHVLARAATAAGSLDGAALREAILALPVHDGVSGPIHFDGSNDPDRPVIISRIDGRQATFIAAVDVS